MKKLLMAILAVVSFNAAANIDYVFRNPHRTNVQFTIPYESIKPINNGSMFTLVVNSATNHRREYSLGVSYELCVDGSGPFTVKEADKSTLTGAWFEWYGHRDFDVVIRYMCQRELI